MDPILSICIPTFNRAKLLEMLLRVLEVQVKPFGDRVEIVVSDNGSPDQTREVVQNAQKQYSISYRRLPRNMGGLYNIVTIATEVAKGKYCWILGDDDLLRPGAVAKILSIIENNPSLPYIFVNHSYEQHGEREKYKGLENVPAAYDADRLLCQDTAEKVVERWEDIVFCSEVPALFTSVVCHIFLKDIWVRRVATLGKLEEDMDAVLTLSYEKVFPHVSMLAPELVGRPAYYVGFPFVMLFVGAQEWLGIWPKYLFTFVLRIADQIEIEGGLQAAQHYRNLIFRTHQREFRDVLFHGELAKSQGGDWTKWRFEKKDDVSLFRLIVRHRKSQEFRRMVRWAFGHEIRHEIKRYLRKSALARRAKKKIDIWLDR